MSISLIDGASSLMACACSNTGHMRYSVPPGPYGKRLAGVSQRSVVILLLPSLLSPCICSRQGRTLRISPGSSSPSMSWSILLNITLQDSLEKPFAFASAANLRHALLAVCMNASLRCAEPANTPMPLIAASPAETFLFALFQIGCVCLPTSCVKICGRHEVHEALSACGSVWFERRAPCLKTPHAIQVRSVSARSPRILRTRHGRRYLRPSPRRTACFRAW